MTNKIPTIRGIVCKGYITRYLKEDEWEEKLVALPLNAKLVDGDAIPYYLQNKEDGKFYEYYGHEAPEGEIAYISVDHFDPSLETYQ